MDVPENELEKIHEKSTGKMKNRRIESGRKKEE